MAAAEAALQKELENSLAVAADAARKAIGMGSYDGRMALELAWVEGITLGEWMRQRTNATDGGQPAIAEQLKLAVALAHGVARLHKAGLAHFDLTPDNILLPPGGNQVVLIDLAMAVPLDASGRVTTALRPAQVDFTRDGLYRSPEHSGRTSNWPDTRSDLYVLGVILYQIIAGKPPFAATDALELVHQHLAEAPKHPCRNTDMPRVVGDIVLKLLAKEPLQRYQSALGLAFDLEKCLADWQTYEHVEWFELGSKDRSATLAFPPRLFGRDAETASLAAAWNRTQGGKPVVVTLAGAAGIGKTALVQALRPHVAEAGGALLAGKFEPYNRATPYLGFGQALAMWGQIWLARPNDELEQLRAHIATKLPQLGAVVLELVPALAVVLGPQPPAPEVSGVEAQNRFFYVIRQLLGIRPVKQQPLLLFLDDVQWADASSMHMLQDLMGDRNLTHILWLLAYRPEEVDDAHLLHTVLNEVAQAQLERIKLELGNLALPDVLAWIGAVVRRPADACAPLAQLVQHKTGGNPFFIQQLMQSLHDRQLLHLAYQSNGMADWQWDIDAIKTATLPDTVVDMVAAKLTALPAQTQVALKWASGVGNVFEENALARVMHLPVAHFAEALWPAVQAALIEPTQAGGRQAYVFGHDRIKQAVVERVPEPDGPTVHYQLAKMMEAQPDEESFERLFEITSQYNQGLSRLQTDEEKVHVAHLNVRAAERALASGAQESGLGFAQTAMQLLQAAQPQTVTEAHQAAYRWTSEGLYVCRRFAELKTHADYVLGKVSDPYTRAFVLWNHMRGTIAANDLPAAIPIGLQALQELGVRFAAKPGPPHIAASLAKTMLMTARQTVAQLADLPVCTDPGRVLASRLIGSLMNPSFRTGSNYFPLFVFRNVQLQVEYGNTSFAPAAYASYAIGLCGLLGLYDRGYRFGQLSLALGQRPAHSQGQTISYFVFNCFIRHWREPVSNAALGLMDGYRSGFVTGYITDGTWCACYRHILGYFASHTLEELRQGLDTYEAVFKKEDVGAFVLGRILNQTILNLQQPDGLQPALQGPLFDAARDLQQLNDRDDRPGLVFYHVSQMQLHYWAGLHEAAAEHATQAGAMLDKVAAMYFQPAYHFWAGLNAARRDQTLGRKACICQVRQHYAKLAKWAKVSPVNFAPMATMLAAELAWLNAKPQQALQHLARAIGQAATQDMRQEVFTALVRMADWYEAQGNVQLMRAALAQAAETAHAWGAAALVPALEKRVQAVTAARPKAPPLPQAEGVHVLDMASLVKASQALSGELQLARLIERVMSAVLENAGAQRGVLLLRSGNDWRPKAEARLGQPVRQFGTDEAPEAVAVPLGVVRQAAYQQQRLLSADLAQDERFAQDPYVLAHQPRSVLVLPLVQQNEWIALLYLENNLAANVFTDARISVLEVLGSQMAISIQNALLYDQLEEKVRERTRQLSEALEELKATQAHLIQSEKMAALGQLIANVAHEINSPIGAIGSSSTAISQVAADAVSVLKGILELLSPKDLALFEAMLNLASSTALKLSSREERQMRRDVREWLAERKTAAPANTEMDDDAVADALVDLGIYENWDQFLPLLMHPKRRQIFTAAIHLTHLRRGADNIKMAVERVSKIVFALKTYSFTGSGEEPVVTQVAVGIDAVLALYRNQLKQGIEVVRRIAPDLPEIKAFPDQLNQLWTNLVHNAIQAMGGKGTLEIDAAPEKGGIRVAVIDSGTGILPEVLPKIFDPFFTTRPMGEGSGLGLHISKKIVERHYGTIMVETKLGRTMFSVYLPLVPSI
jgi:predicted ATPase/signal transduction histidine kinase